MPALESVNLRQKAVYWPFKAYDGNGNATYGTPVEIPCRWEDNASVIQSPNKGPIAITGQVYVDQTLLLDSQIRLGALADLPSPLDNLRVIIDINNTPDIKATHNAGVVSVARK